MESSWSDSRRVGEAMIVDPSVRHDPAHRCNVSQLTPLWRSYEVTSKENAHAAIVLVYSDA